MVYYAWNLHPLGNSAEGHLPLRFIVDPVGSSCSVIRVARLRLWLVALSESPLSAFQYTKWWFSLLRVPNLCHCDRIGRGVDMSSSVRSLLYCR